MNTDPSAVAFETVKYGVENNADVIIVDTAGRHTKVNLMADFLKSNAPLKSAARRPLRSIVGADGSTGQNALVQAREFHQSHRGICRPSPN